MDFQQPENSEQLVEISLDNDKEAVPCSSSTNNTPRRSDSQIVMATNHKGEVFLNASEGRALRYWGEQTSTTADVTADVTVNLVKSAACEVENVEEARHVAGEKWNAASVAETRDLISPHVFHRDCSKVSA